MTDIRQMRLPTNPRWQTHPSTCRCAHDTDAPLVVPLVTIPQGPNDAAVEVGDACVTLTNLNKVFWPGINLTKGDLLRYYVSVAAQLLPHVRGRAMVMKRYPNGAESDFFFMKRAPSPRPSWIDICSIWHNSENTVDFPIVEDLASLLWLVNLGCIDLNPWYARCDDVDRPDYLHFDLDPGDGVNFDDVCRTALIVREHLVSLALPVYAKTSGATGMHLYVPIMRGPGQKEVWALAKRIAVELESQHPDIVTAKYRIAERPAGRVLVDYNQNAWGRTLASVYSARPQPDASVSAPVTWDEVERGVDPAKFTVTTMQQRIDEVGDLWAPVASTAGRADLSKLLEAREANHA